MKKKVTLLRRLLERVYDPSVTNGSHTVSIKWRAERKEFDVVIVGQALSYTHTKEFSVGLYDHPKTMGQLFYGSRWL